MKMIQRVGDRDKVMWSVKDIAFTIPANPMSDRVQLVIDKDMAKRYRIRKLTPTEVMRLMGVKDDDFYKMKDSGISDSQLYKMAGNSIVVQVLEGIFTQMFRKDDSVLF